QPRGHALGERERRAQVASERCDLPRRRTVARARAVGGERDPGGGPDRYVERIASVDPPGDNLGELQLGDEDAERDTLEATSEQVRGDEARRAGGEHRRAGLPATRGGSNRHGDAAEAVTGPRGEFPGRPAPL